jgi:hypothetical protein
MKKLFSTLVVLSVLAAGTAAWAGAKWDTEVYINQESRMAWANLGSARNSSDSTQYFEVVNQAFNDALSVVYVVAQDSSGNFGWCYSNASSLIDVANGIAADSFVQITWNENFECTSLQTHKASYTPPKNP